jgi:hypothetical protein
VLGADGEIALPLGEDAYVVRYGHAPAALEVGRESDGKVSVVSALAGSARIAFVVAGDTIYQLPEGVAPGAWEVTLGEGESFREAHFDNRPWRAVEDRVGAALLDRLRGTPSDAPDHEPLWLIVVEEATTLEERQEARLRRREVRVHLVQEVGSVR